MTSRQSSDEEAQGHELTVVFDQVEDAEEQVARAAEEDAADEHELGADGRQDLADERTGREHDERVDAEDHGVRCCADFVLLGHVQEEGRHDRNGAVAGEIAQADDGQRQLLPPAQLQEQRPIAREIHQPVAHLPHL